MMSCNCPNYVAALEVVTRLNRVGHQAVFAGGCVRDMLLGREPKDFDVATSARPDQIIGLFDKTLSVGAAFGVIVVVDDNCQTEEENDRNTKRCSEEDPQ